MTQSLTETIAPQVIEAMARAVSGHMEGGREFDQMPPDRVALKRWDREGLCSINDATQDCAKELAKAAAQAMMEAMRGDSS